MKLGTGICLRLLRTWANTCKTRSVLEGTGPNIINSKAPVGGARLIQGSVNSGQVALPVDSQYALWPGPAGALKVKPLKQWTS